ncbi:hypothetical protein MPSEU_000697100 [Mayamaea pseudoterrestris]|nr:hypothetical protein MPSEU_000697100 [Mayamaea pseudoterrestris]
MNDNQNLHVQSRGRSSSRVLAPPGGVCSITFGVAPPPSKKPVEAAEAPVVVQQPEVPVAKVVAEPLQKEEAQTTTLAAPLPTMPAVSSTEVLVQNEKAKPAALAQPVSANAFASGARSNGANVMTGRPTSRVLAPPGGHCSITLG